MKCISCGNKAKEYLCENCKKEEILDEIFIKILFYSENKCDNPNIKEFVHQFENIIDAKMKIKDILCLFPEKIT